MKELNAKYGDTLGKCNVKGTIIINKHKTNELPYSEVYTMTWAQINSSGLWQWW